MTDLVKRLRRYEATYDIYDEAADRIEELEEMYMELKRLRKQEALDNLALQRKYEELEDRLSQWCQYYTDGLPSDEVQDLYVDTLSVLEKDGG